jgi:hypothetical protein
VIPVAASTSSFHYLHTQMQNQIHNHVTTVRKP